MIANLLFPAISPDTTALTKDHEKSKIILLYDHMPPIYDFKINIDHKTEYKKNSYIQLFDSAGIDYTEKIFLSDHYLKFEDFDNVVSINNIFLNEAYNFFKNCKNSYPIIKKKILKKLTFMSNKSRPNRMLTSRVLMNMFNKTDINYTFIENKTLDSIISTELLIDTDYNFQDIFLPELYYILDDLDQYKQNTGILYKNQNNWKNFLKLYDQMFSNSTTSIVTEPAFYESGCILTEKTLMSIYAGHFILWPGGYKHAETAEMLGIDVFNDIIDHSYQYLEHPGQRIVEAFLRNREFLIDIELQEHIRNTNIERLQNNIHVLQDMQKLKLIIDNLQVGNKPLSNECKIIVKDVLQNL